MKEIALCFFHYFPYGGLQRDMLALATALHARGHTVHAFCTQWEGEKPGWLRVHQIPIKSLTSHQKVLLFNRALLQALSEHPYDCVIGFNKLLGLDFYFAADNCFKQKKRRLKHLLPRYRVFHQLERAVFSPESKTHIFCLTAAQKARFQAVYQTPADRFTVLPPNLPASAAAFTEDPSAAAALRKTLGIATQDFLLLSIASAFHTKGIDRTLAAFNQLDESLQACCHLVIVGKVNATIQARALKACALASHLHFIGPAPSSLPYLFAADLFLHPARQEAGGIVLLEALYTGTPIITTALCGYSPVIQTANAGKCLTTPFDQATYEKALTTFLHRPLLETYRKNALSYRENHLKPGGAIAEVVAVLEQCGSLWTSE